MSFVMDIARAGSVLLGAVKQAVNSITDHVVLPVSILPPAPVGEILEPVGDAARSGADAVERLVEALTGVARTDENAARTTRRLLATGRVEAGTAADQITVVRFQVGHAGRDWGRIGAESGRVAVYVDGVYHSTVTVLGERGHGYSVNLGGLPAGSHAIELRDATTLDRGGSTAGLTVDGLRAETVAGERALVQRHAPIVQLRDQDAGAGHSAGHSDTPLLLVPAVTRHEDGSRTIKYRIAFSNEEGGTLTPKLLATYGRTGDLEPIYEVRVAADGRVLQSKYQSALHVWRPFDGERVGDRPVLRVATANNNFSTRVRDAGDGAERWSEVAIDAVGAATTDFEVMQAHPWTWTVMAKEILREGKSAVVDAVRGRHQVADPRRYLYMGALTDALRGAIEVAGGVQVLLHDGRRVLAKLVPGFAAGPQGQGALELPAGIRADAIAGVTLIGLRAVVLDEDLVARELAQAA